MARRLFAFVFVLGLWPVASSASSAPQIADFTDAFLQFFDDTVSQSEAERVAAFKVRIAPLYPSFYGTERFEGRITPEAQDRRIARALDRFPSIRETYAAKVLDFRRSIDGNLRSFGKAFPDFKLEQPIYLLHSLGEMDGGTRNLDGAPRLIFGADGMAMYHSASRSESAFFHHELFHIHHRPRFGECSEVWCMLWIEGAASYVAASLNPDAGEVELLLDFPTGTAQAVRAALPASLDHVKGVLESGDGKVMSALFSTAADETGLPPRRGYLIGFLIAKEIAANRPLEDLAELPRDEVHKLVEDALIALRRKA